MLILGLESSCDETAAAVVRDGHEVLSSIVSSQLDLHVEYGGVVPELASRAHVERILPVIRSALAEAGVGLGMIDAVAVGNRPGLIGCLLVGVAGAKALAFSLGKPLIAVDHIAAHLYSGVLGAPHANQDTSLFPALGLVISGGHTSMYRVDSWTKAQRLGSTIDDAIGEAFDKAAAILGLPYPGGPNIDRLARQPGANPNAVKLPISRLSPQSLDFSFSGLKTALLYAAKGIPPRASGKHDNPKPPLPTPPPPPLDDARKRDLAASFQQAAIDAIILKLTRALAHMPDLRTLLTGGGVTANSLLRTQLTAFASKHALTLHLPPMSLCVDNAAMIAGLGYHLHKAGRIADMHLTAVPTTGL